MNPPTPRKNPLKDLMTDDDHVCMGFMGCGARWSPKPDTDNETSLRTFLSEHQFVHDL